MLGSLVDAAHRLAYRLGHPVMRQVWRITRPSAHGAAVALWSDDCLLVVRQSFRPGIGLPAGAIRIGETARTAAARELFEEVGVRADPDALVQVAEQRIVAEYRDVSTMLFELKLDRVPPVRIDRREIVWADWVRPEDLEGRQVQELLPFYFGLLKGDC